MRSEVLSEGLYHIAEVGVSLANTVNICLASLQDGPNATPRFDMKTKVESPEVGDATATRYRAHLKPRAWLPRPAWQIPSLCDQFDRRRATEPELLFIKVKMMETWEHVNENVCGRQLSSCSSVA